MKKIALFALTLGCTLFADVGSESYKLGDGLRIASTPFYVGGYLTTLYQKDDSRASMFKHDDTAVMLYGNPTDRLSVMLEYEIADTYTKTYTTGGTSETSSKVFRPERAYIDYAANPNLTVRVGKFPAFVGIWNQTPIPMLQDTQSKPSLDRDMFPNFTTGIGVFGTASWDDELQYKLFWQATDDLDDTYLNIKTKKFYGASLEKGFGSLKVGASAGSYEDKHRQENFNYVGVSFKYAVSGLKLQGEAMASKDELPHLDEHDVKLPPPPEEHAIKLPPPEERAIKKSAYLQLVYKVFDKNFFVARTDYFSSPHFKDYTVTNLIGWNYRLNSGLSIKAEHKFVNREKSGLSTVSLNILF